MAARLNAAAKGKVKANAKARAAMPVGGATAPEEVPMAAEEDAAEEQEEEAPDPPSED